MNSSFGSPVLIVRGPGYSKAESISPKNRKKAMERMKNPNRKNRNEFLNEFFAEIGIIANPDAMTYLYKNR